MQVRPNVTRDVITRLRRAEGQIRGIVAMLESGRDCTDVVVQLAAVSRALDRAGFRLLAGQLQECLTETDAGEQQAMDLERLEKLFLSLA